VLSPEAARKLVKDTLFPLWEQERERLERIDCWYRWRQEDVKIPKTATSELRALIELSKVPWLNLVVTVCAQAMYVDGYRSNLDNDSAAKDGPHQVSPPWRTWMANGMDRRQIGLHRATLAYGHAYTTVLPGVDPMTRDKMAVIRGVSPRKMIAVYDDPAEDDWPQYAMRLVSGGREKCTVRVFDEDAVHTLTVEGTGATVAYVDAQIHGAGVCPVVRYANMLDLEGRTSGEVEPFIPLAARINRTSYDRMVTQHYSSWKVRTVAGMAAPDDADAEVRKKIKLRQDDILIAEDPDTKFGTLDETPLEGFISAHRHDVETLAAASQTPTHELTGQLANLSAEALAAARASLNQKVVERQKTIGGSHRQTLQLAAALDGATDYAVDPTGRVTWQDMEIRSMSQAADALGKVATMLGVPPTALWGRIPGVEKTDVQEWVQLAKDGDPITKMQAQLARQQRAVPQSRPPQEPRAQEPPAA
jgi:hypothetical protein